MPNPLSKIQYLCLPFSELRTSQLYQILQLRSQVFVVEQNCIYQDIDDKDPKPGVHHLMAVENNIIVGYARLLPSGLSFDEPSIGRVLTEQQQRGRGLGKAIIAYAIKHTLDLWPSQPITIGAQSHLSKLYQQFGFKEISPHYLEDGIPHVDMTATTPIFKDYL